MTNPEDKLSWIFSVFDKDQGGSIDSSEIRVVLTRRCTIPRKSRSAFDDQLLHKASKDITTAKNQKDAQHHPNCRFNNSVGYRTALWQQGLLGRGTKFAGGACTGIVSGASTSFCASSSFAK